LSGVLNKLLNKMHLIQETSRRLMITKELEIRNTRLKISLYSFKVYFSKPQIRKIKRLHVK